MKKKILYIHGLASNGNGRSANYLAQCLGSKYIVVSPDVPVSPKEANEFLHKLYEDEHFDLIIGTSLGGFYASLGYGFTPKILVNPCFDPKKNIAEKIGMGVQQFFGKRQNGETTFVIDDKFLDELDELDKNFTPDLTEIYNTFAFYGENDELIDTKDYFKKIYVASDNNTENKMTMIPCGHRLTEEVIKDFIAPKIVDIFAHLNDPDVGWYDGTESWDFDNFCETYPIKINDSLRFSADYKKMALLNLFNEKSPLFDLADPHCEKDDFNYEFFHVFTGSDAESAKSAVEKYIKARDE